MSEALTFTDLRKRMGTDNKIDWILEALAQSNPIMDDIKWTEGNLPTGNQTTVRTSYPHPQLRRINRGVKASKSTTRQVVDTCCLMEAYSEVDVRLVQLAPDKEGLRRSEDTAFLQGFTQDLSKYLFYGDTIKNPDEFNGLGIRYNSFDGDRGDTGYQCINAGGTSDGKQSSVYIVDWGDQGVLGIYPKGSKAGLNVEDKGEQITLDENGGKYRALVTWFSWDAGLAVKNVRKAACVRNVEIGTGTNKSKARRDLLEKIIIAKNRIVNPTKPIAYVNNDVYTEIELMLSDKDNIYVTRQDLQSGMPKLYVQGIEVKQCDALLNTESVIK